MISSYPMVEWHGFQDELHKIAELDHSQIPRFLKNTVLIGAGSAIGGGLGWLAKGGVKRYLKGSGNKFVKYLPYITAGTGMAVGSAFAWRNKERDELLEKARKIETSRLEAKGIRKVKRVQ